MTRSVSASIPQKRWLEHAGFFSLYDRPPAPGRSLPGLVCPYRQVGLCTVIRETCPLLAFLFSDAFEAIEVLDVDPPPSQFHDPLVLESTESKGYGHPSGSYDGSQLLVGVVVGYDSISTSSYDPLLIYQPGDKTRQAGIHPLVDHIRYASVHQAQVLCQQIHKAQPYLWLSSEEVLEIYPAHEGKARGLYGSDDQALKPKSGENCPRCVHSEGDLLARRGHLVDDYVSFLHQEEPAVVLWRPVELLAFIEAKARAASGDFL